MLNVLFLSIHPAPYRDCVFESLSRRERFRFSVAHYFAVDDGHTEWDWVPLNYPYWFSSWSQSKLFARKVIHFDILWCVIRGGFDVIVVPGYSRPTSLLAILIGKCLGKSVIVSMDNVKQSSQSSRRSLLISLIKHMVHWMCDGYWVPGFATTQYLADRGVTSQIAHGSYCLDVADFSEDVDQLRQHRVHLRNNLQIRPDAKVLLAVGKMKAFRRYDDLIVAWSKLNIKEPVELVLVGDGAQYESLVSLAKDLNLTNVKFIGARSTAELPKYYAISDAYVHPGSEPYSTALELAAIAGLEVLASRDVGYVHELLERGCHPLLFDSDVKGDLRVKLQFLLSDEYLAAGQGKAIARVACDRTPDWAAGQLEALVSNLKLPKN